MVIPDITWLLLMKMPAITVWPHAHTVMAPMCPAVIHVSLTAPMLVEAFAGLPDMVRGTGNLAHPATA